MISPNIITNYATRGLKILLRLNQTVNLSSYNYVNTYFSYRSTYTDTLFLGISSSSSISDYKTLTCIIETLSAGLLKLNVNSLIGEYYVYIGAVGSMLGTEKKEFEISSIYLSIN